SRNHPAKRLGNILLKLGQIRLPKYLSGIEIKARVWEGFQILSTCLDFKPFCPELIFCESTHATAAIETIWRKYRIPNWVIGAKYSSVQCSMSPSSGEPCAR